jgi:hypothetical protein
MDEQKLKNSFAFVMNVASLEAPECDLGGAHVLRRGTATEVNAIRDTIQRINLGHSLLGPVGYWEHKLPGKAGSAWFPLEHSEWRYFVIAFDGPNNKYINDCIRSRKSGARNWIHVDCHAWHRAKRNGNVA